MGTRDDVCARAPRWRGYYDSVCGRLVSLQCVAYGTWSVLWRWGSVRRWENAPSNPLAAHSLSHSATLPTHHHHHHRHPCAVDAFGGVFGGNGAAEAPNPVDAVAGVGHLVGTTTTQFAAGDHFAPKVSMTAADVAAMAVAPPSTHTLAGAAPSSTSVPRQKTHTAGKWPVAKEFATTDRTRMVLSCRGPHPIPAATAHWPPSVCSLASVSHIYHRVPRPPAHTRRCKRFWSKQQALFKDWLR